MTVFTVHQPPLKKYENAADPERFIFVRDGFSFWAFLLGPIWMLRHRMWLALIGHLVVLTATVAALGLTGASGGVSVCAILLLQLLVGMEAGTLRRFTLGRRRFRHLGVIVGGNRDAAERRFFDSWIRGEMLAPSSPAALAPPPAAAVARKPPSPPEVIGLFPQPGAPR